MCVSVYVHFSAMILKILNSAIDCVYVEYRKLVYPDSPRWPLSALQGVYDFTLENAKLYKFYKIGLF